VDYGLGGAGRWVLMELRLFTVVGEEQ